MPQAKIGTAMTALDLANLAYIDGIDLTDEHDVGYAWGMEEIELEELPAWARDWGDEPLETMDQAERFANLQCWLSKVGVGRALAERPIIALRTTEGELRVLKGFHRIAIATRMGARSIPAAVAVKRKFSWDDRTSAGTEDSSKETDEKWESS